MEALALASISVRVMAPGPANDQVRRGQALGHVVDVLQQADLGVLLHVQAKLPALVQEFLIVGAVAVDVLVFPGFGALSSI